MGVHLRRFDASVSIGLSEKFPAGHETAAGQRAHQEAEREGVASEVDVEEVAVFGLLVEFVREYLDERAFMRGCHESELVERSAASSYRFGSVIPVPTKLTKAAFA